MEPGGLGQAGELGDRSLRMGDVEADELLSLGSWMFRLKQS